MEAACLLTGKDRHECLRPKTIPNSLECDVQSDTDCQSGACGGAAGQSGWDCEATRSRQNLLLVSKLLQTPCVLSRSTELMLWLHRQRKWRR